VLLGRGTLVVEFPNASSAALKPVGATPQSLPLIGISPAELTKVISGCVRCTRGTRAGESYIVRRCAGESAFPGAGAADLSIGDEDAALHAVLRPFTVGLIRSYVPSYLLVALVLLGLPNPLQPAQISIRASARPVSILVNRPGELGLC